MDEDLTGRTGDLLAGLALFRDASVPAPSPELTAMFAATATVPASALPTPRRVPVYKRILAGVPSKVAAAALGALLAGSLGAGAGALTGTMTLASNDDDAPAVEAPAVDDSTVVADDHEDDSADEHDDEAADAEDEATVDEVDDDGANDAAADADLAAVPVPTSVSEAAHTHDFDEACGNHGHYVSFFAQNGTELACAVEARAAESEQVSDDSVSAEPVATDTDSDTDSDASTDGAAKHGAKGHGKVTTTGTNWQSQSVDSSSKGGKSNKGKGGR